MTGLAWFWRMSACQARSLLLCLAFSAVAAAPAQAEEWSAAGLVHTIEVVSEGSSSATYYFQHEGGWGASGCPSAQWAYIHSWEAGSRDILASAMQARQMSAAVLWLGACENGYFHARAIWY